MPDILSVTQDPNFYRMTDVDQLKTLNDIDPNFGMQSPLDQRKSLGALRLKYTQKKNAASDIPNPGKPKDAGFFSTLGSDITDMAKAPFQPVINAYQDIKNKKYLQAGMELTKAPLEDVGKGIVNAQVNESKEAVSAYKDGRYSEMAGHGLAAVTPVFGPAAAQIGGELGDQQYGQAAAHTLELVGPEAVGRVLPKKIGPIVKNKNNPVMEAAKKSIQSHPPKIGEKSLQLSVGQRTGNRGVQRIERGLENFPGSTGHVHDFVNAQQEAIASTGNDLVSKVGGQQTNDVGAGEAVQSRLKNRISNLKSYANTQYDAVRARVKLKRQAIQTGTRVDTLTGKTVPTFRIMDSPVNLEPIALKLRTIYNELDRNLKQVKKENSLGFLALKDLVDSTGLKDGALNGKHLDALDFDRYLSAVKSITHDGNSSALSSFSQGLAKQVIKYGEVELQKTLGAVNADQNLLRGRRAVKSYYAADKLLQSLDDEPAELYKHLSTGGDRVINELREINKIAPKEVRTVGRRYLDGMIETATKEGGWGRGDKVLATWDKLGPETKQLLYGPKLAKELEDFFVSSRSLTRELNPSGSAHMVTAFHAFAVLTETINLLANGHVAAAAGTVAEATLIPYATSRLLMTPGGAKLLTEVIKIPKTSARWRKVATTANAALLNNIHQIQKEQQEKESDAATQQQQQQPQ